MLGRCLVCALVLGALVSPAAAQDAGPLDRCDDPPARKPQQITPNVGAFQVSTDAPIRVLYTAGYFAIPGVDPTRTIRVVRCSDACDNTACDSGGLDEFVPGRVQVIGDELVFLPDQPWTNGATYGGIAHGIDDELPFSFCAGSSRDITPPHLDSISDLHSSLVGPRCEARDGGYRIDVSFPQADDSGGPPGSIEYQLFQTRGAGITDPVRVARLRAFAGTDVVMAFVLPRDEASTAICVRVAAVDGVGNVSMGAAGPHDCIDPVQGNYFFGCSAAPQKGGAPFWWLAPLALVLFARRRATAPAG